MRRRLVIAPLTAVALAPALLGMACSAGEPSLSRPPASASTASTSASSSASGTATSALPVPASSPAGSAARSTAARPAATTVTLMVVDTPASGRVWTDPNGQVLYHYDGDDPATGVLGCTGGCLRTYPPMLVAPGTVVHLLPGMAGTPGTMVRPDGVGTQVTLNGQPLYTYSGDLPGDANGIATGWHTARALSAP